MSLTIDVISDIVCPWCYIGKKKLQTAIDIYASQNPDAEIPQVRWHAFQLNPDLDESGMDRAEYVLNKFGNRASTVYDRVTNVGLEVGIEFAFDKIQRQPNTRKAHSLIAACAEPALQEKMVQLFFDAYFILSKDLTDDNVLSAIALKAGLDQTLIEKALHSEESIKAVEKADQYARSIGVQGVPFFVFNEKVAVSGAQGPETLVNAMTHSQGIG